MSMSDIQNLALDGLATTDNLKLFQLFMKAVNMCGELEIKNQELQETIVNQCVEISWNAEQHGLCPANEIKRHYGVI